MTDKEKKQMCQCRECNHVFHQSNLIKVHKQFHGIDMKERACPKCGSSKYGLMDYPWDEYFLIYKSKRFFNRANEGHVKPFTYYYDTLEDEY